MTFLPLASSTVTYEGPACLTNEPCASRFQTSQIAVVQALVGILTGVFSIVTAIMLRLRRPERRARYGLILTVLSLLYLPLLVFANSSSSQIFSAVPFLPGPAMVLTAGLLLIRNGQSVSTT